MTATPATPDPAASPVPPDPLAALVAPDDQRKAARMAQDAFAQVFRRSVGEEGEEGKVRADDGGDALAVALANWSKAAGSEQGAALRLALLLTGLDQWGLAWTQAFGLAALPGLSELVGRLRTGLDPQADARFLAQFDAIARAEENAIDFKVELRRGIHLALWHAAIAGDERDEALRLTGQLGGLMLALVKAMPQTDWRLVADALAHIQIRCLAEGLAADGIGQEATQALFAALSRELPAGQRDAVMRHATQAAIQWQQARRAH